MKTPTFNDQALADGYQEGAALVAYSFTHNKPLDQKIIQAWVGDVQLRSPSYATSYARLRGIFAAFEVVRETLHKNNIRINIDVSDEKVQK